MFLEELNKIVALMDLEKIQRALEDLGYRNASLNGVWEFDPVVIANAKKVEQTEHFEDVFDDKKFIGDLHTLVEGQDGYEFVVITVEKIYRNLDNKEFPCEMLLFTNAPINEECVKEQSQLCRCKDCKRTFTKGELVEVNGRLICDDCFQKDLDRFLKRKSKR